MVTLTHRAIEPTTNRASAIATIEAAFRDDPVCRWIWPGDAQYEMYFAPFVEAFAGEAFSHGSAYTAEGFAGVALWLPPGVSSDEDALGVIAERSIAPENADEAYEFLGQQAQYHPHEPHWYLPLIGVDPSQHGRGIGSQLLDYALRIVDEQRMPAYLEATTERNRALYERHGFVSTGQVIQAGSPPPWWPLWRRPR
jgi:ribosomal protein S18 acetylase RimI-like enzyme